MGKGRGLCGGGGEDGGEEVIFTPKSERKCRDIVWIVFFAAYWFGMLVVANLGRSKGNPNRLMKATDYHGWLCGTPANEGIEGQPDLTHRTLGTYPRMHEDMIAAGEGGKVYLYTVCVTECPKKGDWICNDEAEKYMEKEALGAVATAVKDARAAFLWDCTTTLLGSLKAECQFPTDPAFPEGETESLTKGCWPTAQNSDIIVGRCIAKKESSLTTNETCFFPEGLAADDAGCITKQVNTVEMDKKTAKANPMIEQLQSFGGMVSNWAADIAATQDLILRFGVGGAILGGFVWIFFLSKCAGVMVWLAVLLVLVLAAGGSAFAWKKAGLQPFPNTGQIAIRKFETDFQEGRPVAAEDLPPDVAKIVADQEQFMLPARVAVALTIVLFLVICAQRKNISIAVGILKEAGAACKGMIFIMFYPIVSVVALMVLFGYTIWIGILLFTAGEISAQDTAAAANEATNNPDNAAAAQNGTLSMGGIKMQQLSENNMKDRLLLFHFFGFLWTANAIQGVGLCTMAGAFANYYFDKENMGKFPVAASLGRTIRFHLGSVFFGSFVIAVVQSIRMALYYVEKQFNRVENKVVKMLFKILACYMWCLEKCMKFISRNAYIMVAMRGRSFCKGCRESFGLIFANMARIAVVNGISMLILTLCKLTIAIGCTVAFFMALEPVKDILGLHSTAAPTVVTLMLSLFVANSFMNVYAMGIDTILLCVCVDEKVPGEMHCSADLQKYLKPSGDGKKDSAEADA